MNLPSREKCEKLMDEFKVLDNIKEHSKQVNRVAVLLANKLKEKGIDVNIDLVDRASLLHDIVKTIDIKDKKLDEDFYNELKAQFEGKSHEHAAGHILEERGYPELAKVIIHHGGKGLEHLKTWEEKLISYSDARVAHDQIVSVKERYDEAAQRHMGKKDFDPNIRHHCEPLVLELEAHIFEHLDFKPEDLKDKLKELE